MRHCLVSAYFTHEQSPPKRTEEAHLYTNTDVGLYTNSILDEYASVGVSETPRDRYTRVKKKPKQARRKEHYAR